MTKFRTKFTLLDIKPRTRLHRVQTEENIAAVSASVNEDLQKSIRRNSQQLGLCHLINLTWKFDKNHYVQIIILWIIYTYFQYEKRVY